MILEELRVDLPGEKQDTASIEQKVNDEATEAEYERRTVGMSAEASALYVVLNSSRQLNELIASQHPGNDTTISRHALA